MPGTSPGTPLSLGVIGTSAKENEHRLPLHPDHLSRIHERLRRRITLEDGYGERFGLSDRDLAPLVAGFAPRAEVIATSDVVLLPKPQLADVALIQPGKVLWGWPHCVQDPALTQLAIDRDLTLIAFEAMNHWTVDGSVGVHVFHANNELAGYCSVLQALQLRGLTGDYGRRLTAVVIGFGATARGAVTALNAHGVHDVSVLTHRRVAAVGSPIHSVRIVQFDHDPVAPHLSHVITAKGRVPLAPFLAERDIIVNCTLQDTAAPLIYLDRRGPAAAAARHPDRRRVLRPRAWGSAGRARRPSTSRCSRSATASPTTASTTARRTSGTRRPGRTARRCCRSWRRCWPDRRPGTRTRRSTARSRSATGTSSTRRSWPSRGAPPSTRTWSSSDA